MSNLGTKEGQSDVSDSKYIETRAQEIINRVQNVVSRLEKVSQNLFGSEPTDKGKSGVPTSQPLGFVDVIRDKFDHINELINMADDRLNRIEKF